MNTKITHLKDLKRFSVRCRQISQVDIQGLLQHGIGGVILDLDNTIISEDDAYLSPLAEPWVKAAKMAGLSLVILSNSKRKYRVRYWSMRLDIPAIAAAHKPLPRGFLKALKHLQMSPQQTVVIGDSLHTDILGAYLWGCAAIQVASLPHPPRWWEKILGRWLQMPYPSRHELIPFNANLYRSSDWIKKNYN